MLFHADESVGAYLVNDSRLITSTCQLSHEVIFYEVEHLDFEPELSEWNIDS